jgi:hypothetical protein
MDTFSAADTARELLDMVQSFQIRATVERFAADGVLELPNRPSGLPKVLVGHTEIGRFMGVLPKIFERLDLGERTFHECAEPNKVIVEYRGDGLTHTGRPYNNRYIAVFEFDDSGAVVMWREYFDPIVLLEAVT